jgi:hypothetical protein
VDHPIHAGLTRRPQDRRWFPREADGAAPADLLPDRRMALHELKERADDPDQRGGQIRRGEARVHLLRPQVRLHHRAARHERLGRQSHLHPVPRDLVLPALARQEPVDEAPGEPRAPATSCWIRLP